MAHVDLLASYPGLTPQAAPDTPEFERLIAELVFAMAPAASDEAAQAIVLRIMVARGYWPIGTRHGPSGWQFPRPPRSAP